MSQYYSVITSSVLKIVISLIGILVTAVVVPWLNNTVVPYLKEKRVYNIICKFVKAAEKLGESGAISKSTKKDYVVDLLTSKGIEVTGEIDALIESAVEELDLAVADSWATISKSFEEEEKKTEEGETAVGSDN